MPPTVSISPPALALVPGSAGSFAVEVAGDGAGDVRLDVAGHAGEWAVVVPPVLAVPAGGAARARVVVQVPRSARVAPGPATLAVRAGGGPAAEATVDVLPFAEVRASLSPRASRGRAGGRHTLHVENLGNGPVDVALEPSGDEAVRVEVDRAAVGLAPGESASVAVSVGARRRRWAGRPRSRPFRVAVRGGGADVVAEGLLVQEPLRWPVPAAALAAGALAVAALALGGGSARAPDASVPPPPAAGAVPAQTATCPPGASDPGGGLLVVNFLYCPGSVTVAPGTELRWTNRDQAPHTVSADGDDFDTGNFGQGETRTVRFERPGTYHYFCRLHPFMRATVVVA